MTEADKPTVAAADYSDYTGVPDRKCGFFGFAYIVLVCISLTSTTTSSNQHVRLEAA